MKADPDAVVVDDKEDGTLNGHGVPSVYILAEIVVSASGVPRG